MKDRRFYLYALAVILLVVAAVCWLLFRSQSPRAEHPEKETAGKKMETKTSSNVTQRAVGSIPSVVTNERPQLTEEQRRESINEWESHRESVVEFWGKVIDQNGQPVEGVKIKSSVTSHKIPIPGTPLTEMPYYYGISDMNGIFYIKSDYGRGFTIESIEKEGYILPQKKFGHTENLYWYNYDNAQKDRFRSDPNHPVVFKMWKLAGPEPLVVYGKETRIPYDGTPTFFDLLKGEKVTSGGDLKVTLKRDPLQIKWGDRNYNWVAYVDAVDGGIIVSQDEFMYQAPETGYESGAEIEVKSDDLKWTTEREIEFYLKSRAGKYYSRVKVKFMTGSDKPTTGFSISSYLNPQGSRNLEYDPALHITPARIEQIGFEAAIKEAKANAAAEKK